MQTRLKSQDDILDPAIRQQIINEIEGPEERRRRREAYKRSKVLKDRTDLYVRQTLESRFNVDTVAEMAPFISNLSIMRKIIDKLARVYSDGVKRSVTEDEETTERLELLDEKLKLTQALKTTNKIVKAQRNAVLYLKPCSYVDSEGNEKWRVRPSPLHPHLYSAVEEPNDRTEPMVYILSNHDVQIGYANSNETGDRVPTTQTTSIPQQGDTIDQGIADKKEDENRELGAEKTYIWWTDKYHFTTRGSTIVGSDGMMLDINTAEGLEQILNPIQKKPFVDFAIDRDNSYWAEGGQDLADGTILVNTLLTNAHAIAVDQGYGQLVVTGKNLPATIPTGPTRAITLEQEEAEDPNPTAQYINSAAPLEELAQQALNYVGMLLTTNNLSVKAVATSVGSGQDIASGIAMILDQAESREDVSDQRIMFACEEGEALDIINRWLGLYEADNTLSEEQRGLTLPDDIADRVNVEFGEPKVIQSEKEKLENLQKRKDMGLNTQVEIIQRDRPGMSDEDAKVKLEEILKEKSEAMLKQIEARTNLEEDPADNGDKDNQEQSDE